jgi:superoxide dismutase, Cu-Zn family
VSHGIPPATPRHVGDLGNLQPSDTGVASVDKTYDVNTAEIVGRGLIVHAKKDNGSQPLGGAGDRLAQCVLGIAAPIMV